MLHSWIEGVLLVEKMIELSNTDRFHGGVIGEIIVIFERGIVLVAICVFTRLSSFSCHKSSAQICAQVMCFKR
jgi:hypothetical protein